MNFRYVHQMFTKNFKIITYSKSVVNFAYKFCRSVNSSLSFFILAQG